MFGILAASLLLISCGGGSDKSSENEVEGHKISPETTTVKGSFKDCFEVVDRNYKVTYEGGAFEKYEVKIELRRTDTAFPFDVNDVTDMFNSEEASQNQVFGIGVEFLDEDGEVIATYKPTSEDDDCLLLSLNSGETATFNVKIYDDISTATKFRVTSIVKENEDKNKALKEMASDSITDLEDVKNAVDVAREVTNTMGALMDLAGELSD